MESDESKSPWADLPENAPFFAKEIFRSFRDRLEKNPRYSLRAFSRSLGISPSWLLRVLRNERIPSVSMLNKIATKLEWSRSASEMAIREALAANGARKINAVARLNEVEPPDETAWVDSEDFAPIADRVCLAVLELPEIEGFVLTPENAASELGISTSEAERAIAKLVESRCLDRNVNGAYRKTNAWIHTEGRSRTTVDHRRLVEELLDFAAGHVSATPWGERLNYWGTYAIDPDEIPKVKPIIERFLIDIESVLAGRTRKKVYTAGFYLCPASLPKSEIQE